MPGFGTERIYMDNNTNNRETSQIVLAVQKATFLMDPFFKLTMTGAALLITYLARMQKEKKLSRGECESVKEFIKATDGKYFIANIPVENGMLGQGGFAKELEELKELGVHYKLMPDLNKNDGYQQLIVYDNDRELFNGWHERYLISQMKGGEHNLQGIKNLTNENVSIISVPFEDNRNMIFEDLNKLGVNYSILPDLNVGDGEIQLLIANSDMPKVKHWYGLYAGEQLKKGIEVPDMKSMDLNSYQKSGELTEEQYMDTASEELKKANEKYEGKEQGEIEKSVMNLENRIKGISDETYEKYHNNPDYLEISINKEMLVDKCNVPRPAIEEFREKGYFASRVPGTWMRGEKNALPERCLLLPSEQVFVNDEGNTYIAFLSKDKSPLLTDLTGKFVPVTERMSMSGMELYQEHYDKVDRKLKEKQQAVEKTVQKETEKAVEKTAEETIKGTVDKAPKPPAKAIM